LQPTYVYSIFQPDFYLGELFHWKLMLSVNLQYLCDTSGLNGEQLRQQDIWYIVNSGFAGLVKKGEQVTLLCWGLFRNSQELPNVFTRSRYSTLS